MDQPTDGEAGAARPGPRLVLICPGKCWARESEDIGGSAADIS